MLPTVNEVGRKAGECMREREFEDVFKNGREGACNRVFVMST